MSRGSNRINTPDSQLGDEALSAHPTPQPAKVVLGSSNAALAQPHAVVPVPNQRQPHGPDSTSSTNLHTNPGDDAMDTDDDNTRDDDGHGGPAIDTNNEGDDEDMGGFELKLPPPVSWISRNTSVLANRLLRIGAFRGQFK